MIGFDALKGVGGSRMTDLINTVAAVHVVTEPWWMQYVHEFNKNIAEFAPTVGIFWILFLFGKEIYLMTRGRVRHHEPEGDELSSP